MTIIAWFMRHEPAPRFANVRTGGNMARRRKGWGVDLLNVFVWLVATPILTIGGWWGGIVAVRWLVEAIMQQGVW